MGNQPCSTCEDNKAYSTAYGIFDMLVENNTQYAILSKSILKDIIQPYQLDRQLSKRSKISSIYVVKLYCYKITFDSFFTSVELKYQYIPETLGHKYARWVSTDKIVSEAQIGNIVSGVEGGLLQLHRVGISHRFINFNTILCIKSMYKLMDTSMITFLTGLDLARGGNQDQFLSQKNLNVLNFKGTKPDYSIEDDLFSLGLVIIVIVLKCPPKDLYIENLFGQKKHNIQLIEKGMKTIETQYNDCIAKKVRQLLQGNLKQSRATCNFQTTIKKEFQHISYD